MRSETWPDRGGDERDAGSRENGRQNEVPRHFERVDGISEDERGKDVEGRHLRHPQKRREDDLLRMLLDNLDDRGPLDFLFVQ